MRRFISSKVLKKENAQSKSSKILKKENAQNGNGFKSSLETIGIGFTMIATIAGGYYYLVSEIVGQKKDLEAQGKKIEDQGKKIEDQGKKIDVSVAEIKEIVNGQIAQRLAAVEGKNIVFLFLID